MRRRWMGSGLLIAATLALGVLHMGRTGADEDGGLRWEESLAAAQAAAETSGKPIFLVFRCVP